MSKSRELADLIDSSGNLSSGDGDKAIFGDGNDLQIYHDGSNSHIIDEGTGSLLIKTNGAGVYLKTVAGDTMASFIADSSTNLYYDNSKKLATTSTGVDVTGTVTADGLSVDGNVGIGATSSFAKLHVKNGASGRTAARGGGSTKTFFENNGNQYTEFAVPDTSTTNGLLFSGASAPYGLVNYNTADQKMDFYTNSASRMSIDSSGRVTMPYQPAFKVLTNYSALTAFTSVAKPNWSITDYNVGSHFNLTNDSFTAPVGGRYLFNVHSLFSLSTSANDAYIELRINGVRKGLVHSPSSNITSYLDLSLSEIVSLSANDVVDVRVRTSGGGKMYNGTTYNSFQGTLLG